MSLITLSVPDELAKKLQSFDESTLANILENALAEYERNRTDGNTLKRVPISPLPSSEFDISMAEWQESLLNMSAWDEDTLQTIENTRDYINKWQTQTFS